MEQRVQAGSDVTFTSNNTAGSENVTWKKKKRQKQNKTISLLSVLSLLTHHSEPTFVPRMIQ